VIRAAGASGQVEDMNLRITVLRDLEGVAHFIPNGEIKVVSNLAKEWSRAVVNVGVAYKEDLDRVVAVLDTVGQELSKDPIFGPGILEPPQVLGVENFGDSQVTLRTATKTRPLKQWETARELREENQSGLRSRTHRDALSAPSGVRTREPRTERANGRRRGVAAFCNFTGLPSCGLQSLTQLG